MHTVCEGLEALTYAKALHRHSLWPDVPSLFIASSQSWSSWGGVTPPQGGRLMKVLSMHHLEPPHIYVCIPYRLQVATATCAPHPKPALLPSQALAQAASWPLQMQPSSKDVTGSTVTSTAPVVPSSTAVVGRAATCGQAAESTTTTMCAHPPTPRQFAAGPSKMSGTTLQGLSLA